jgi:hypothetical protein
MERRMMKYHARRHTGNIRRGERTTAGKSYGPCIGTWKRKITMTPMTQISAAMLLLVATAPIQLHAAAPPGAGVCLNLRDIERTEIPNDRSILFYMRDGKVWRNDLRTACPMLKVSPYTEKLTSDLVCANQQFIHLTMTGDDCALGDFTQVAPQH